MALGGSMKRSTYLFECFLGVADTFAIFAFWAGMALGHAWLFWLGAVIIFAKLAFLPLAVPVLDIRPVEALLIPVFGPRLPVKYVKLSDRFSALLTPYLFYLLVCAAWFYLQYGYLGMSWLTGLIVYTLANCVLLFSCSCTAVDAYVKGGAVK